MESYHILVNELLRVKFGRSSQKMNCVTELLLNPYVIPVKLTSDQQRLKPQLLDIIMRCRNSAMQQSMSDFTEIIDLYVSATVPAIAQRNLRSFRNRQRLLATDISNIQTKYTPIESSDMFNEQRTTYNIYIIVCRKMKSNYTENCKKSLASMRLETFFPKANDFFKIYFDAEWKRLLMTNSAVR